METEMQKLIERTKCMLHWNEKHGKMSFVETNSYYEGYVDALFETNHIDVQEYDEIKKEGL